MKIISWNVNGIRALTKKINFYDFIKHHNPDIICLNEIKSPKLQLEKLNPNNYFKFISWNPSKIKKGGYAGTIILSNIQAQIIEKSPFDNEGRLIMMEFDNFILINVYVPNSGQNGLKRLKYRTQDWDPLLRKYIKNKMKIKPCIITGDFNIAFNPNFDLWNPKYNDKPGTTPEERENFSKLLDIGLIDSFRFLHPKKQQYTYWSYLGGARKNNKGWRIDYFLIDKKIKKKIKKSYILDDQIGSDHCPIGLEITL